VIVAFSTSSSQTSVALIAPDGAVIASRREHAPMQASGACFRQLESLFQETGRNLDAAELFAADLGPGSFTGVKVAVTIAKTLAFSKGKQVVGADSFDLIAPDRTVVMPSKKGEFFVRRANADPIRTPDLPDEDFVGFGPGVEPQTFPDAARFAALLPSLRPMAPEMLVPNYLIEPSISTPKSPLSAIQEPRG